MKSLVLENLQGSLIRGGNLQGVPRTIAYFHTKTRQAFDVLHGFECYFSLTLQPGKTLDLVVCQRWMLVGFYLFFVCFLSDGNFFFFFYLPSSESHSDSDSSSLSGGESRTVSRRSLQKGRGRGGHAERGRGRNQRGKRCVDSPFLFQFNGSSCGCGGHLEKNGEGETRLFTNCLSTSCDYFCAFQTVRGEFSYIAHIQFIHVSSPPSIVAPFTYENVKCVFHIYISKV